MTRILILGGGFGGVSVYQRLHQLTHRRDDIQITLISRHNFFWFTPMLHEVATGGVAREHIVEPLRQIVRCCGHRFVEANVSNIDVKHKKVETTRGVFLYDYLVVALGTAANRECVPGAHEYAIGFREITDGIRVRNQIVRAFEDATRFTRVKDMKEHLSFAIVGGGLTGTELAAQMADWFLDFNKLYPEIPDSAPTITLIHGGERLMPQLSKYSSAKALSVLEEKGVRVLLNTCAKKIDSQGVWYGGGKLCEAKKVIMTSGVVSVLHSLMEHKFLDHRGFLVTKKDLSIPEFDEVFGVGDTVSSTKIKMPQSAQAAEQAGNCVAENIMRLVRHQKTSAFHFRSFGNLVPLGDWNGIAEIGPFHFSGKFAWWLRRTIFMLRLPSLSSRVRVVVDWSIDTFRSRETSEL